MRCIIVYKDKMSFLQFQLLETIDFKIGNHDTKILINFNEVLLITSLAIISFMNFLIKRVKNI
jgi:hypothetical protein